MRTFTAARHARSARMPLVFLANLFHSFHAALLIFVNSSYIEQAVGKENVGLVYSGSSLLSLVFLLNAPRILARVAARELLALFVLLGAASVAGLAFAPSGWSVAVYMAVHLVATALVAYCLDLYLESMSDDKATGSLRTAYLTVANLTYALSPMLAGSLAAGNGFPRVYAFSLLFLVPLAFISIVMLRSVRLPAYKSQGTLEAVRAFAADAALRTVFGARFLLDFFYSWMVVYMPIYLHDSIGFGWDRIGMIFAFMLLPFVLFEIPVGRLADKYLGEKEIMFTGFAFMLAFTLFVPALRTASLPLWAALLFFTRVGASLVEAATESHFFKLVGPRDDAKIGIYRTSPPLAYLVGPLSASVLLAGISVPTLFTILAFVMLAGIGLSLSLKDTK